MGFDPYRDAENFRQLKRKQDPRALSELGPQKRRRGVAFGTGYVDNYHPLHGVRLHFCWAAIFISIPLFLRHSDGQSSGGV
jgi:hypothetical protein